MKCVKYQCAILLGIVWLIASFTAMAEQWPDRKFKVFIEDLDSRGFGFDTWYEYETAIVGTQWQNYELEADSEYKKNAPPITKEIQEEIERWLNTVAAEYEAMGFKAPQYTDIDSSVFNDQEVYKVYIYPFRKGSDAGMLSRCENSGKLYMKADSRRIIKDGKLTDKAYQDLAHELFHAIQGSYNIFYKNGCPGAWITEGTAEAVGIEMARKLYPGIMPEPCQMGVRLYSETLYVPGRATYSDYCGLRSYLTQSHWQFLGEYKTRKFKGEYQNHRGYVGTPIFIPPDYSYLHEFFSTKHAMGSQSKEYSWLDQALDFGPTFNMNLHTAYHRFAGTYASYWMMDRRKHYRGATSGDPLGKQKNWIERSFGKCASVPIYSEPDAPIPTVSMSIGAVEARCIKVDYDFSGQVGLTFIASSDGQSIALESLAISTNGGSETIRRHASEQDKYRIGAFPIIYADENEPQYFIVSNVARENPGATSDIKFELAIVPNISTTAMAKENKETPDKGDASASGGPTNTDDPLKTLGEYEKEEWEAAGMSRSWKGQVRQDTGRPCTRPFEASPCGPRTDIDLMLIPDTVLMFETLAQPSMSTERKFRLFDDVVSGGSDRLAQITTGIMDDYLSIMQQDGTSVSIAIPQIQPGFTGTISNAHISVSKAVDADGSSNGNYAAVGPWTGSCSEGYRPSTGTLTVYEFTSYVLRGSFSAQLVDMSTLESCQSGAVIKPDSGTFNITEIDWNLDLPPPEIDSDALIDDMADDINSTLPGLLSNDFVEYAKEQARKKQQEREQAKQNKGNVIDDKCDCTCEMEQSYCEENTEARCCMFCEPVFYICNGNLQQHAAPLTDEEQVKQTAEIAAMRERYQEFVEKNVPEYVKQQMMDQFDQAKTFNEKKLLMMIVPTN